MSSQPLAPAHATRNRWSRPLMFWVAAPYVFYAAWSGRCVLGYGGWSETWVPALIVLYAFAMLFAFPVGFVCVFLPSAREWGVRLVLLGGWSALAFVLSMIAGSMLRMHGFALAAERAEPLIAAIQRHIADHGAPPSSLSVLVPRYLDVLPDGLPPLRISSDPHATHSGKQWMLEAGCSSGLLNWDAFLYLPEQDYPSSGWGGRVQRIGKWAYVHE